MLKIGILASHRGSNLQAVIDACQLGKIPCQIVVVISNNSKAFALERARAANIPALHLSARTENNELQLDIALCNALKKHNTDLVMTLGYMKKLGDNTLDHFRNRILNVHPSLLPKFGGKGMYGQKIHEAVLAAGESHSGASIHLLDGDYDTGPVIAQQSIQIAPEETVQSLEHRILKIEHMLLVDTLDKIARKEIELP